MVNRLPADTGQSRRITSRRWLPAWVSAASRWPWRFRHVLGDLLASLSIALDKPFHRGRFPDRVGDFIGSVEYIGIKSTRLRSLTGEQIVMPNADLLAQPPAQLRTHGSSAASLFAHWTSTYETPRAVPQSRFQLSFAGLVMEQNDVRFDRCHLVQVWRTIRMDFESVYYVLSADYNALHGYSAGRSIFAFTKSSKSSPSSSHIQRRGYCYRNRPEFHGGMNCATS